MPDVDQPLPVGWPVRGLALDRGYGHQPPDSTILGKNVRVCEPSTMRLRGGSRPGLSKYAAQVPSGSGLIQELNYVVIASGEALDGGIDDPGAPVVPDPSSPGPSSSWGTTPLGIDPNTGKPVTGSSMGTRIPLFGGGTPKRHRGGSGYQQNKNVSQAGGGGGTAYCTGVLASYRIHAAGPDIAHFDGQEPAFHAFVCLVWTTIDEADFPAEVADQKAAIAAKAGDYLSIVNQREAYLAFARTVDPSTTFSAEYLGALVTTPNPINVCDYSVANSCEDPNF